MSIVPVSPGLDGREIPSAVVRSRFVRGPGLSPGAGLALLEERLRMHRRLGQAGSGMLIVRVAQAGSVAFNVDDIAELSGLTTRRWFPIDGGAFTFEFLYAELSEEMAAATTMLGISERPMLVRSFVYDLPLFLDASEIIHSCIDAVRGSA